jgi:delta-aminolevulinic acid dehydratase/porphobilinogen synthase
MSHGHCGVVKETFTPQSLGAAVREALTPAQRLLMVKNKEEKEKAIQTLASAAARAAQSSFEIDNDSSLDLLARTSVSLANAGIDIIAPSDMMDGRVGAIRRADGDVDNDTTLERYASTAIAQAQAGAHMIAPSGMMDGQVGAIRRALDRAAFTNIPVCAYSAKYASAFYGPFREAADSAPQFGDRRSYQMDGANLREAMREIEADVEEGADMIMVKPAMPYLDVIAAARDRFDLPLAAYQVSGEYAMIEAAAQNGWIERDRVMMESLLSIRRAGASIILTYYAKDAAKLLG